MEKLTDNLRKNAERLERALERLLNESQEADRDFETIRRDAARAIALHNHVYAENFFFALRHLFDWGFRFQRGDQNLSRMTHLVDRGLVISVDSLADGLEAQLPSLALLDTILMPRQWVQAVALRAQVELFPEARQIGIQAAKNDFWVVQSRLPDVFLKNLLAEILEIQKDFLNAGLIR